MKKGIRGIISLVFCVVLVFSMATSASAVFVSWEDANGSHTAGMSISNTTNKYVKYASAEEKSHTQGESDTVQYGKGDVVYYYWSYSTKGKFYAEYLEHLMVQLNLVDTKVSTNDATATVNFATIKSSQPTGTYTVGSSFKVHSGTWEVLDGVSSGSTISPYATSAASGTFEGPDESAVPLTQVLYKK